MDAVEGRIAFAVDEAIDIYADILECIGRTYDEASERVNCDKPPIPYESKAPYLLLLKADLNTWVCAVSTFV